MFLTLNRNRDGLIYFSIAFLTCLQYTVVYSSPGTVFLNTRSIPASGIRSNNVAPQYAPYTYISNTQISYVVALLDKQFISASRIRNLRRGPWRLSLCFYLCQVEYACDVTAPLNRQAILAS
ncbi:hypothetical protein CPC08DRAFT_264568 [Agrocybe pediades]|nr:hypothetical protein CPC08DRAFT_264568 [Agrocybe pediades]